MPRRDRTHILRTLARWALLSAALSGLLFFAAGTTRIPSLRAYLLAFSGLLLITMLVSHPDLVEERFRPAEANLDAGARFASGFLFLLTLTAAALDVGRLHASDAVPGPLKIAALVTFAFAILIQLWAMAVNPFFSPVARIQSERGHHLVTTGPYRFVRHPGYLAMLIAMPASALAIDSWLALIPALAFSGVIVRRTGLEDRFLRLHLPGYAEYSDRVRYRLFLWWRPEPAHPASRDQFVQQLAAQIRSGYSSTYDRIRRRAHASRANSEKLRSNS
jgi:protein-S-isoprenylcysteine O-methyltransferase Ste14